jgi:hypothetical protein
MDSHSAGCGCGAGSYCIQGNRLSSEFHFPKKTHKANQCWGQILLDPSDKDFLGGREILKSFIGCLC